jgi:predicted dehydrogenase
MFRNLLILALMMITVITSAQDKTEPVRVGVVGLVHTHVHWILGREDRGDIEIVGIVEPNRELAERYSEQHGYSMDIVFDTIEEMIDAVNPEAVTAFNTIFEHLEVVEICAPKGIHVMVEKPLAVSLAHAKKMEALARKHGIQLLTNYETTWYQTNHKIKEMVDAGALGELRKVVVHDGHQGPEEIGVNEEFLEWLIDPKWNGAGALTDFGCYGANLVTWLMKGQRPLSVTAVTQQIKPDKYPLVDDEATIILTYPKTQAIIQASWNWTFSRKDMEVYGTEALAIAINGSDLMVRSDESTPGETRKVDPLPVAENDPFAYLAGVIRGTIVPERYDLSSLENNMIVMEILDEAIRNAK